MVATKSKRKERSYPVSVRFAPDVLDAIKTRAEHGFRTISAQIEYLVNVGLSAEEPERQPDR